MPAIGASSEAHIRLVYPIAATIAGIAGAMLTQTTQTAALGSITGSFVAAMLIGVSDIAGKYYAPEFGAFFIYVVMVAVLMWKPAGLFGKR
jgi:branched-subunit amino acid ABC-type transport system permease component